MFLCSLFSSLRLLWMGSQGTPGGIRSSYTLYVLRLMTSVVDDNQYPFWLKSKNCVPLIVWIQHNVILEAGNIIMQLY